MNIIYLNNIKLMSPILQTQNGILICSRDTLTMVLLQNKLQEKINNLP